MAANRTLTEDHHATGQNVGTFNGNSDWRTLISTGEEVAFAKHNAFTASDIHRIDD
ncbi:hypothetical protein SDC9_102101 [bioreactor metagenome]|uniref:Uncharacterized protein n=1 Tax=bioreactor metagenome TaxID=1076179 RepID=A0A645AQH1_9ZZZZ